MIDVAVIGAGMAGLVCAQQLAQAGYTVVVVEKSRGLGGRVATRRLYGTCADHGVPYLENLDHQLVQSLCEHSRLQVWTDTVYEYSHQQLKLGNRSPRYVAPTGMSAIAKFLATGLEIWRAQRVQALALVGNSWHLTLEATSSTTDISRDLQARAVVVAIPAPQALTLLAPLATTVLSAEFLNNLRTVEFDPCLSVIAGYPVGQQPNWKAISFVDHPNLWWLGLDSSKRMDTECPPVIVLHSSASFAQSHLEQQDLHSAGQELLTSAATECSLPWLSKPEWMQVHRWRYAFARRPWHQTYLSATTELPLICCGDWCGGDQLAGAMRSGLAAAQQINQQLQQRALPGANFFAAFTGSSQD